MKRVFLSLIILFGIIFSSSGCQSSPAGVYQTPKEFNPTTKLENKDMPATATTTIDIPEVEINTSTIKDGTMNSIVTTMDEASTTTESMIKQKANDISEESVADTTVVTEGSMTVDDITTVTDMVVTIELPSGPRGGRYTGTVDNGLAHGKGKFVSQNSLGVAWYYEGEFVQGRIEGEGVTVWEDGQRKEGVYKNNLLNGFGKLF